MQGKIIRGIAGFYYVHVPELGILECKAKGVFRNRREKPLVGDNVEVELLDPERKTGNVETILPRQNTLIRPAVANVDQAIVIFAVSYPKPNLNLLDRFLLMMKTQGIPVGICFNKMDMVQEEEVQEMILQYCHSGVQVYQTSTYRKEGLDILQESLLEKTTVLAGPSGTGKSSVINAIFPDAQMETGQISEKIKRGKHTTRHSELFSLGGNTYLMDTPGFTSLGLPDLEKEELRDYYQEFLPYQDGCRFLGCVHVNEPDCAVKEALDQGKIPRKRYDNYKQFFEELSQKRRY
ncbi:MAG: ribosome small subunit-dependent GTPase A [Lachnospiraceae bacterium]|nr:ribosome small subunit-dependent GTPase A [Lachnospiraceae bacterium]